MKSTQTEKERIEELEDAMCRANAEIATHWQVRGQQMEEICWLRELITYVKDSVCSDVIRHGFCECEPDTGDIPCEYCAAKHFIAAWNDRRRIEDQVYGKS